MSVIVQANPFDFFADLTGAPLSEGYVWIGQANRDPRQFPVTVYADENLMIPVAQPLRTNAGYIVRNNAPTFVYIAGDYSVLVEDKMHRQVFYVPGPFQTESNAFTASIATQVSSVAQLRLLDKRIYRNASTQGYYTAGDGANADYWQDINDTTSTDNGGTIIVAADGARWKMKVNGRVKSQTFGILTGSSADQSVQVQRAVTVGCTNYGGVDFQPGQIRIDNTIKFPNLAYDIFGSSGTRTEFWTDTENLKMFDFTLCNGPAKTMQRIGFTKITPGTYAGIVGVYTENTNGLYMENCWSRGLFTGLRYHGSFINMNNCAFEYNYFGVYCDTKAQETTWLATTYYRNEQVDFRLTGDNSTFKSIGSNHIGTRIEGIRLDDCTNAQIFSVSCEDSSPSNGFTPNLLRVTGISSGNIVTGFSSSQFGRYGIIFDGANVKKNIVTGINIRNTPATGNRGIRCLSTSENYFEGNIEGVEAGVEFNSTSDGFKGKISNCSVGSMITVANYCSLDVKNSGNTIDVQQSGTTILYLKGFTGDPTGFSAVPYIVSATAYGTTVEVLSMPTGLSWKKGDRAVNTRNPTPGTPKAWARLTTGSSNVLGPDWYSEGNL